MLLELYSSRLLRRHTAVLALSLAAVFESQPQSHLWSSVGLCFHFFSPPLLPLPIYRWCFFLCSLQTLISSLSVNLRAASSEQPELTAALRSTARRGRLPESWKDNVTLWPTPNINYPRRSFMQQKLRVWEFLRCQSNWVWYIIIFILIKTQNGTCNFRTALFNVQNRREDKCKKGCWRLLSHRGENCIYFQVSYSHLWKQSAGVMWCAPPWTFRQTNGILKCCSHYATLIKSYMEPLHSNNCFNNN